MINFLSHLLIVGKDPDKSLIRFYPPEKASPSAILPIKGHAKFCSRAYVTEIGWDFLKAQRLREIEEAWSWNTEGLWEHLQQVNFWNREFSDNPLATLILQVFTGFPLPPSKKEFDSRMASVAMPIIHKGVLIDYDSTLKDKPQAFQEYDQNFWNVVNSLGEEDFITCYSIDD